MAVYTYTDPKTGFVYSYNDAEPTIKDQIRGLIGDIEGTPIWYISDNSINATASLHTDDLYTAASEAARKCMARVLSLNKSIQQGTRFRIENFDPVKAYDSFEKLANELANKSTNAAIPSYGAIGSQICPPFRCEPGRPGWTW